jgi:hypothetical protein
MQEAFWTSFSYCDGMGYAVRWCEVETHGPWLDVLAYVADMGEARRLAAEAELRCRPTKQARLRQDDPLTRIARQHPGELLWRIYGDNETPWQIGASGAAQLRAEDVDRFMEIRSAARKRRRNRR